MCEAMMRVLQRIVKGKWVVIDDIGMQPDYYLDETIPQYKWVELVNEVLNN